MQLFLQTIAITLIASILTMILKQGSPGIAMMLSLITCAMILTTAVSQLKVLTNFVSVLDRLANIDDTLAIPLFKAAGISVVAEIAELICHDSGNTAMGKAIQFVASAVILCLGVPMMTMGLELIERILKGI